MERALPLRYLANIAIASHRVAVQTDMRGDAVMSHHAVWLRRLLVLMIAER